MLDQRQQFKAAFLHKCAQEGLSWEEILQVTEDTRIKLAEGVMDTAKLVGKLLGGGALVGGTALVAAPIAAGALGGWGAAKLTGLQDEDPQEVKKRELIATLQRHTQQAQINRSLKDYQQQNRRPGRPLLA